MRTSAVLAGSFGGSTKVVSARLNSAAIACIWPPDNPSALRTTPRGLPANCVPVKTSTVTKCSFMCVAQIFCGKRRISRQRLISYRAGRFTQNARDRCNLGLPDAYYITGIREKCEEFRLQRYAVL